MVAKYVPILKAKPGEFMAVSELKECAASLLPLFEIGRITNSVRDAKRFKGMKDLTAAYLNETAGRIADAWSGRPALIDAFHWQPDAATGLGEPVLPYVYQKLLSLGVKVRPVIGYDRWGSDSYRIAMQGLDLSNYRYCCLRLDTSAIEDSAEADYFEERVVEILNDMGLEPNRCGVLLDFGDASALSVEQLVDQGSRAVGLLAGYGFRFYATAGCSLPPTIDGAIKTQSTSGTVPRKEALLWQTLRTDYRDLNWKYGDYGVRGPNTADDVISPHTNGKIRYTTDNSYFVARGHSLQIGDKGGQMHGLAKAVIASPHFMGTDFSWGDKRVIACSRGEFMGRTTDWIAIDTNHHVTWVVAEVMEFEQRIAASVLQR